MKRLLTILVFTCLVAMLNACSTGNYTKTAAGRSSALSTSQVTLSLAAAGGPHYQYSAGLFYEAGTNGLQKDIALAVEWYTNAAKQGYLPAYSRLGSLYEFGKGLPRDKNMAVACYEAAALNNLANFSANEYYPFIKMEIIFAQQQLGRIYSTGDGVQANRVKGYMWNKIVLNHTTQTGKPELDEAITEFQSLASLFNAVVDSSITSDEWRKGELLYQLYFSNHAQWQTEYHPYDEKTPMIPLTANY